MVLWGEEKKRKGTKEDLLSKLNVKQLRQLAKKSGVKLEIKDVWWGTKPASRKDDIIEVLLKSPKVTKKRIQTAIRPTTKKVTKKETTLRKERAKATPEVKQILRRIKGFAPYKRPRRERELEAMLVSYLRAFYPDIRTQLTYERARIDAQVGRVGIEIKFQPGTFDRLYGQIDKYLRHLDYVIAVIGYEKSKEATRFFKQRLKERNLLNQKVFVLAL